MITVGNSWKENYHSATKTWNRDVFRTLNTNGENINCDGQNYIESCKTGISENLWIYTWSV